MGVIGIIRTELPGFLENYLVVQLTPVSVQTPGDLEYADLMVVVDVFSTRTLLYPALRVASVFSPCHRQEIGSSCYSGCGCNGQGYPSYLPRPCCCNLLLSGDFLPDDVGSACRLSVVLGHLGYAVRLLVVTARLLGADAD